MENVAGCPKYETFYIFIGITSQSGIKSTKLDLEVMECVLADRAMALSYLVWLWLTFFLLNGSCRVFILVSFYEDERGWEGKGVQETQQDFVLTLKVVPFHFCEETLIKETHLEKKEQLASSQVKLQRFLLINVIIFTIKYK